MIDIVYHGEKMTKDETAIERRRSCLTEMLDMYISDSNEREKAASVLRLLEDACYNKGRVDGHTQAYNTMLNYVKEANAEIDM